MTKEKPAKSAQNKSTQKMAASREIIDRLFWDVRLNRHAFIIGFHDRQSQGINEKSLVEWMVQSDIPEHRLRYIRCGNAIVWDRENRLDLVSTGQLPDEAWTVPETEPVLLGFELRPVYVCEGKGDKKVLLTSSSPPPHLSNITAVSFNVLCDAYEPEGTPTQQRLEEVVRQLQQCDADIMAIQEASPAFLACLLAQDWMQGYCVSEILPGESVKPYGLFLCSRIPFTLVEYRYSKHKRALVGTWELAAEAVETGNKTENKTLLRVAVVHLPSNGAQNAAELRSRQLKELLDYLQTQPGDCMLVGDFNAGEEELDGLLGTQWIDLWRQLHPKEPGFTFDTDRNPMAAYHSRSGKPSRYDRIVLRRPDSESQSHWQPQNIELFACNPIADTTIFPSDHFGLKASLVRSTNIQDEGKADQNVEKEQPKHRGRTEILSSLELKSPTYRSAIAIIPPVELFPNIQALRRQFDRHFVRWMPHINLIYGFLPEADFEAAVEVMTEVLAQIQPFEVTLAGYKTFEHRRNCTAWLEPATEPRQALQDLQAALEKLFPQCNEQGQKSPAGFTPHLSIGQFNSPKIAWETLPPWQPLHFRVESVALISRREDEPFEVRSEVKLGGSRLQAVSESSSFPILSEIVDRLEPELSPAQQDRRQAVREIVAQACSECLGSEVRLHSIGSARLGVESAASDIDVLCVIPTALSGDAFLQQVQQRLQGLYGSAEVVRGRVSALRMEIDRVAIDLLYARAPSGRLDGLVGAMPKALRDRMQQELDPASWRSLVGCLEADLIGEIAHSSGSMPAFRWLARAVKAWAKARQIHGQAWGFPGSFSWMLLAAWAGIAGGMANAGLGEQTGFQNWEALFVRFFQRLSQHDWSQPIALTPGAVQYKVRVPPDWFPVINSIAPYENSARNVTRSTAYWLQRELERGATLAGKSDWAELFAPATPETWGDKLLVVKAVGCGEGAIEACKSWLKGHLLGLVLDLEQQFDLTVRPGTVMQDETDGCSTILGLIGGVDSREIEIRSRLFLDRFDELQLEKQRVNWQVQLEDL